jgi:sugar phosphate isomerase/epimerase
LDLAGDTVAQLNAWAEQCDLPLHLEYAAYNPSFSTPQDLIASVSSHPYLRICLDVGHVRVGAEILGIDEWDVVRMLAPYTASIHLWTTRGREDVRRYHHVPVHPSLTPADGWIDVPRMLEAVLSHNPDCAIVFEPNILYNPDPNWQAQGVAWVRGLVAPCGGRCGRFAGSSLETRVVGEHRSLSPPCKVE